MFGVTELIGEITLHSPALPAAKIDSICACDRATLKDCTSSMTPFQVRGKPALRMTELVEPMVHAKAEYAMVFVSANWPSRAPFTYSLNVEPSYVPVTRSELPGCESVRRNNLLSGNVAEQEKEMIICGSPKELYRRVASVEILP